MYNKYIIILLIAASVILPSFSDVTTPSIPIMLSIVISYIYSKLLIIIMFNNDSAIEHKSTKEVIKNKPTSKLLIIFTLIYGMHLWIALF